MAVVLLIILLIVVIKCRKSEKLMKPKPPIELNEEEFKNNIKIAKGAASDVEKEK
jgi:hypothetical protein